MAAVFTAAFFMIWQKEISLPAKPKGFHLVTRIIEEQLPELPMKGILHVFILHTSAGLTLNENADPDVRTDLDMAFDELAPENHPKYTHTAEGPDDMPAHIKSSLVTSSVSIPVHDGRLVLGTWQGIYLCEFRMHGGSRKLFLTLTGE